MDDYMTIDEFRILFPEFKSVSNYDTVISFFLDAAKSSVNKCVFQKHTKMAHGFQTAKLLSESPYARTIRQEGQESNYHKAYDEIRRSVAPRMIVLV